MIIVSGRLYLKPDTRADFLKRSTDAIKQARLCTDCYDFVVAADPLEDNRVNIYEEWVSKEALLAFRGSGMTDDLSSSIVRAEVTEHELS